jgi:hypothetical protein
LFSAEVTIGGILGFGGYLPARASTIAWPKRVAAIGLVPVIMSLSFSTGAPV